jgi:hypothetical protein
MGGDLDHGRGPGLHAYGLRGPILPRDSATEARLRASKPKDVLAHTRTAHLPIIDHGLVDAIDRFGGPPMLLEGTDHPRCEMCEEPMSLLVQLDTSSIPPGIAAGDGLLQLLACMSSCQTAYAGSRPFSSVHLQRLVPRGRTAPSHERTTALPLHPVRGWMPVPDLPDPRELEPLGVSIESLLDDTSYPYPGEKVGGWPLWVQDIRYPPCPICGRSMFFVAQIDSERLLPVSFGDMGIGHLTQCPEHPDALGFGWDAH